MPNIASPPPTDKTKQRRADLYQTFILLCETRAIRWRNGELELGEAVDWLHAWAKQHDLVYAIGVDAVQAVMSRAFAAERDDLSGWVP